ncbi:acrylyl-CoA reductase [Rhodovastum atsumiense]|uniref:Oxidoreductase n=1 Tax=Rhodovastum atsumiense TaxID=504468 RepID=A0A5M6IJ25_9PROT|nr:MDR family oxidoreductase [Rhodovastum atsumiense]KAA5608253.1 oxidoreductase [Rhodovastum atsumiense]CAH2603434.1 acrylyl-CoA reductase [Rhodovastum atsumiense]
MQAVLLTRGENGVPHAALTDLPESELMEGEVTLRVTHSGVNYKDGLAVTGLAPVVRRWPMVPGIDLAGVVEVSTDARFAPGDAVILNGWGVGETHLGGWAERARVKADWLLPQPAGFTPAQAMAIGTAGYTAMLTVLALEDHGLEPARGKVVVTGAAGGVGSVAIALLARRGWHVVASTGRPGEAAYLKELGAAEVIDRAELSAPGKPLQKERWAAAIDAVGSHTLANLLAGCRYGGAVAACGLAGGLDLPTSVAPFILRGVALLGIDSVMAPIPRRQRAWQRLAEDLDPATLARATTEIGLDGAIEATRQVVEGKLRGRTVVRVG